ncbi:MAG: ABC transporter permease, partial [Oscillospiraceae bacterium]|nr:ABC transporter permease [Oscillospiraceae bacterium]
MPRFILKRLAVAIPVLLGVTFVVFAMMSLTGGDPARMMLGEDASAAEIAALRGEMGLNDPFLQRYARYLLLALRGDLGVSWSSGLPVAREVFTRLPVTFRLAVLSTLLAVTVGISAGVFSAVRRYSFWDGLATVIAMMSLTMPGFWLALLLVLFFSVYLGWLPPSGLYGPLYYILPVISISAASTAAIARTTRSGMLEVISQDYIRTVRARGMPETGVILRHALKNALIPIITVTGIQFAVVLGGAVVNEQVFALPGLG